MEKSVEAKFIKTEQRVLKKEVVISRFSEYEKKKEYFGIG